MRRSKILKLGRRESELELCLLLTVQQRGVLETRQLVPNGVTYAKPHITKLRLNYNFISPRNRILSQSGITGQQ